MEQTKQGRFLKCASNEKHPHWDIHTRREKELYPRIGDIRNPYERDYTRILHCLAYRRLKHKTQVFFNIDNDHICTRMEHVQHVESVSCTIAKYLGLNTDLTRAIAMGHDLGHAPFGHEGEVELSRIRKENKMDKFWHERNSLRVIDYIELLESNTSTFKNLDLTYAVRDGIISHCGELDENVLKPRRNAIDLGKYSKKGKYSPYTWEGCVVKISDKIVYVGRDIEDAVRLKFISEKDMAELNELSGKYGERTINTTVLINDFIVSICENSSPEEGIRLSEKYSRMLNDIKHFNNEKIYKNPKFNAYKNYAALVIRSIYEVLIAQYDGADSIKNLLDIKFAYPNLVSDFLDFINKYMAPEMLGEKREKYARYENRKIYGMMDTKEIYVEAILDFISGMTDRYAVAIHNELLKY